MARVTNLRRTLDTLKDHGFIVVGLDAEQDEPAGEHNRGQKCANQRDAALHRPTARHGPERPEQEDPEQRVAAEDVPDNGGDVLADALVAANGAGGRQDVQPRGEGYDEEGAGDELGLRDARQRGQRDDAVGPAVLVEAGDDAKQQRERDGEHEGGHGQDGRIAQLVQEQWSDGQPHRRRRAQMARQQVSKPPQVAQGRQLVKPQLVAQRSQAGRGSRLTQDGLRCVTGYDAGDDEHEQRDEEEDEADEEQPADDEPSHAPPPAHLRG